MVGLSSISQNRTETLEEHEKITPKSKNRYMREEIVFVLCFPPKTRVRDQCIAVEQQRQTEREGETCRNLSDLPDLSNAMVHGGFREIKTDCHDSA